MENHNNKNLYTDDYERNFNQKMKQLYGRMIYIKTVYKNGELQLVWGIYYIELRGRLLLQTQN